VIVKRNRKKRRGQRFKPKIINKKLLNILPRKIVLTPTYFAHKLEKQQQKIIIKRIIIIIILLSLSFILHMFSSASVSNPVETGLPLDAFSAAHLCVDY